MVDIKIERIAVTPKDRKISEEYILEEPQDIEVHFGPGVLRILEKLLKKNKNTA